MRRKIRANEVFVPGGLPEHTYVERPTLRLEERLGAAADHLCKLVTVTGPTKSGKTVLTHKVFPQDEAIWLDGGAFSGENDLWLDALNQLGEFSDFEESNQTSVSGGVAGVGGRRTRSRKRTRTTSPKTTVVAALAAQKVPIVIDDFHYLPRDMQASVVRALKAPIFVVFPQCSSLSLIAATTRSGSSGR